MRMRTNATGEGAQGGRRDHGGILFAQLVRCWGARWEFDRAHNIIRMLASWIDAKKRHPLITSSAPQNPHPYYTHSGHCVNLAPEYDKAASALKGVVTVGAVDGTVSQQLMQKYGVRVGTCLGL